MSFDGFISYSHAADGRLAPAVQRGLHRLAKPWHRRRALWIFRDQTGLSVTPALWTSIQKALDTSDYFLLMASPEAARSPWVDREIEHWVATKPADRILPVVTDGEWEWDPVAKDFAASSTAVPQALRGVFAEEPLYLDLRWARDDQHLSLRHSRFRDAIAQLAAPMHGVSKDDLEGEDVQQHRRAARLRLAAVTSLVVLSGLAMLAGVFAARNAAHASAAAQEARAQHREASQMRNSAAYFADEALRQEGLAREQQTRAKDAAAEAERQEKLALEQKGLAEQATSEASRQLTKADRAAERARAQERLAKRQSELAEQSAQEMRRSEERAKEQEQIAKQQELLAQQATAEAEEQEKLAEAARADAAVQQGNAEQQQRIAISRRLINEARETMPEDPQAALRLGVAAQRVHPEVETRRAVAGLVVSTRYAGGLPGVHQVEYGPGHLLVTRHEYGSVSLWNAKDRGHPVRLSTFGDAVTGPNSMAMSRDGQTVAIVQDGAVILWDVSKPTKPARLAVLPKERNFQSAQFSPDGRTLVTGNRTGEDSHSSVWDLTGSDGPMELSALTGPGDFPGSNFAFSRDGDTLAVSHGDTTVWDLSDRRNPVVRSTIAAIGSTASLTMSPVEPLLVVGGSQGYVYIYDVTDPAAPKMVGSTSAGTIDMWRMSFTEDGRMLAAISGSTSVVWNFSAQPVEIARVASRRPIGSLSLSRDGRTLATADDAGTATMWTVREFAAPRRTGQEKAHPTSLLASQQSADGRSVTTVGGDGKAVVWDVRNRSEPVRRTTVGVHSSGGAGSAVVSTDGRLVVAAGHDGTVAVTDLAKSSQVGSFDPGLGWFVVQAISPDKRTVVLGGDGQRQVWDLTDPAKPAKIANLTSISSGRDPAAFSPDGSMLAIVDDKMVWLADSRNPAAPAHLSFLDSPTEAVSAIAFSPNSRSIVTGGNDQFANLWDITDPRRPHRHSSLGTDGHLISAVVFSPDSQTVALGGRESHVILADISRPSRPVQLANIQLDVFNRPEWLAFSPDSTSLAVTSEVERGSSYLGLWDLTELNALRADPSQIGCQIAGRGLTAEEWAREIPELPYRRTCR